MITRNSKIARKKKLKFKKNILGCQLIKCYANSTLRNPYSCKLAI